MLDDAVLSPAASTPIYQQLYDHLRKSILDGRLEKGSKFPSTRLLAAELGVSRNTILNAYGQLMAEGYIESIEGKGTFVSRVLPEQHLTTAARPRRSNGKPLSSPPGISRRAAAIQEAPTLPHDTGDFAFRTGMPSLDAFPYELWAKYVAREAHRLSPESLLARDSLGYRPLREAIANHVTVARQVRCTSDQVLVVSGAQGALDLAARVLINPGEKVWIEDPGYFGAQGALVAEEAQLIPIPVDHDGMMVEVGLQRAPDARMAYLTPSHQFPLGVSLSLSRRLLLLNWAYQTGAYILEDDYDSEYRFTGRPLASLQGLDELNRTIYIGTFSKVLFPALRLGYLIVPEALVDAFRSVRRYIDGSSSSLEQQALASFMTDGHLARHIRRMRVLYAGRRQALLEAAQGLPLEILAPDTGMHLVGWLPEDINDQAAARQAATHQVHVLPVSTLELLPPSRNGLVLGYAAVQPEAIKRGMERLALALDEVRRSSV